MSRRAVGLFATLMLICVFGCGSEEEPAVTLPDDSGSDEEVVIDVVFRGQQVPLGLVQLLLVEPVNELDVRDLPALLSTRTAR